MTCIIVLGLYANNVDLREVPFPNNTNYSHLGGKPNHIFNSLISLTDIFSKSIDSPQHPCEAKQTLTSVVGFTIF